MRALLLHQPWASLIALKVKTVETRSWKTGYRGPLAIHAAKKRPGHGEIGGFCYDDCECDDGWIAEIHSRDGYTDKPIADWIGDHLTLGAVMATCTLTDVVPITFEGEEGAVRRVQVMGDSLWLSEPEDEEAPGEEDTREITSQRPYGDYRPGRWAWLLSDIVALPEPIPARGHQGLWKPDDELATALVVGLADTR